jgi:hypothetical protein
MKEIERNPRNAPGPFYVENGQCVSCGAPRFEAADLITMNDEVGCYFHRQPETPAEIDAAIRAMFVSCVGSYRYGGKDPIVLRRLAEMGCGHLCDHPLTGHPVIIRRYARFLHDGGGDALALSASVVAWFHEHWKRGACTTPIEGDVDLATFEFTHDGEHGRPLRFAVKKLSAAAASEAKGVRSDSAGPSESSTLDGPYRRSAPTTEPSWLLARLEGEYPPIWLHDVLVKNGCTDIRWFSVDEWNAGGEGQSLPY